MLLPRFPRQVLTALLCPVPLPEQQLSPLPWLSLPAFRPHRQPSEEARPFVDRHVSDVDYAAAAACSSRFSSSLSSAQVLLCQPARANWHEFGRSCATMQTRRLSRRPYQQTSAPLVDVKMVAPLGHKHASGHALVPGTPGTRCLGDGLGLR